MRQLPDIAATLFTTDYRAVKLRGKLGRKPPPGTGSCFDATDAAEVRDAAAKADGERAAPHEKPGQPYWDCASTTYRLRSPMKSPHDFVRAHSGLLVHSKRPSDQPPSPPKAGAFKRRQNLPDTAFRRSYERGDIPVAIEHRGLKNVIRWRAELAKLDYMHFLPLFFDGIRETQDPFRFLAVKGCEDLLHAGGDQILPVVPFIVQPLKRALDSHDEQVMINALKLLQKLVVSSELVGQALVPHYRQLLPACCMYGRKNRNLLDAIDYSQHEGNCLGEVVGDTLALLEARGGPDAFINIKYVVPTYESCLRM